MQAALLQQIQRESIVRLVGRSRHRNEGGSSSPSFVLHFTDHPHLVTLDTCALESRRNDKSPSFDDQTTPATSRDP